MPLTVTRETEGLTPVGGHDRAGHIRCEYCEEPLRPEAGGRVAWEPDPQKRYIEVVYLHHACLDGYEDRVDAELVTTELGPFLLALVHNLEEAG